MSDVIVNPSEETAQNSAPKKEKSAAMKLRVGKVVYDLTELQKLIDKAASNSGRIKSQHAAAYSREFLEMDGGVQNLMPPSVISQLIKDKRVAPAQAKELRAFVKIAQGIAELKSLQG
jgi:hypothetical protein